MTVPEFNPEDIREDVDLEAKLASGRDGRGALPSSLFETYSAFANGDGGVILLGVRENEDRSFTVAGIERADAVMDDFWNLLNNPRKVSCNLISDNDVRKHPVGDGRWVIEITVPRAPRKRRPVFINGNPLTGTFQRRHTGDYRCTEPDVRRMLAEQMEDSRDARILEGFDFKDIDMESFRMYRNRLGSLQPDHPFNNAEDSDFMRQIGGWGKDRQNGVEGLTLAGLLMFGKYSSIQEAVPYYFVDYRELPADGSRNDWVDRLKPDGTWSGNLFDFYRRTILRLFRDVKVPFKLVGDQREDETPIHKALRESLVNALIHADYAAPSALLVLKAPDYFEFRNPGRMRISVEDALAGGHSDCRNRHLQTMFALIGLGEKAGSGIPRVLENWKSQHYRPPELLDDRDREYTLLRLRTVSLLPETTLELLGLRFGTLFKTLDDTGRMALATAEIEGFVTNDRLQQIIRLHPRDITHLFKKLVDTGMLEQDGIGRGATYRVSGIPVVDLASSARLDDSTQNAGSSSAHLDSSSAHLDSSSAHYGDPCDDSSLIEISYSVSSKGKVKAQTIRDTILSLCNDRFLSVHQLGVLLKRSPDRLRERFVKPMLMENLLERRFPQVPNHEKQAYRTRNKK
jgi:predicted HTH transcriptional regulator